MAEQQENFWGRRIVEMEWGGETVEVVEGLWLFGREPAASPPPSGTAEAEIFHATEAAGVDELGIGMLDRREALSREVQDNTFTLPGTGVQWEEPLMVHRVSAPPNDPRFGDQWGLEKIAAAPVWGLTSGDPDSVLVAVLDTGVPIVNGALSHPELQDEARILSGGNHVSPGARPVDDHGHGTHVLGIAAAETDNGAGIAGLWHRGKFLVIKAFDRNGLGNPELFKAGVVEAIQRAEGMGVNLVINYSGGGSHPMSEAVRLAVAFAQEKGALIVAAAGNRGAASGVIDFPARHSLDFQNVIAVGAVTEQRTRWSRSSFGPALTIVAPGAGIVSTLPDYDVTLTTAAVDPRRRNFDFMDGTSHAAPFVSALAALIWSHHPGFTARQVRDRIIETADPLPPRSNGRNDNFGFGLINVTRALS